MKNKDIELAHQQAKIYEEYYRPSFNFIRSFKSIFGVLLFGNSTVVNSYIPKKKGLR
jgi:hypothetical protein